ncbi:unnamed protein product [Symbiodinium necroappetens]|uniref:Uncharacterized protein n=1 Tax=Symbiodinium necroappetens TaxID=1628268 RepID=A0A812MMY5_9DINO|nr:unnamed protein product [Symbiodinium necroappetens]
MGRRISDCPELLVEPVALETAHARQILSRCVEDCVGNSVLFKGLLKKGRNEGEYFLLSVGLLGLWGKEGLTDNTVTWGPRGQFFDHLVNLSLVSLLGSLFSGLEQVKNFLTFFRKAGFLSLFRLQVISGGRPPGRKQAARASSLDRSVPGLLSEPPEVLNRGVAWCRWLGNSRKFLLTSLTEHSIDIQSLRRGASFVLLYPLRNRGAQLLSVRVVTTGSIIQRFFVNWRCRRSACGQQKVVHYPKTCFESEVTDVQSPGANGWLGYFNFFRFCVCCGDSREDKVDLARSGLIVGCLIELGGLWRATPRVERGEPVALEKRVESVRVQGISTCVKGCIAGGSGYVWRSWLNLGLKVTGYHKSSSHGNASNRTAQFTKQSLPFITQDNRINSEVVWKLVAIEELNPSMGSLNLRAKDSARLDFFVANGICFVAWVDQREDTVSLGLGARVYGTPALNNKFRGHRPVSFLKANDIVLGMQETLLELLPQQGGQRANIQREHPEPIGIFGAPSGTSPVALGL